jgi:hypothetical protein
VGRRIYRVTEEGSMVVVSSERFFEGKSLVVIALSF